MDYRNAWGASSDKTELTCWWEFGALISTSAQQTSILANYPTQRQEECHNKVQNLLCYSSGGDRVWTGETKGSDCWDSDYNRAGNQSDLWSTECAWEIFTRPALKSKVRNPIKNKFNMNRILENIQDKWVIFTNKEAGPCQQKINWGKCDDIYYWFSGQWPRLHLSVWAIMWLAFCRDLFLDA